MSEPEPLPELKPLPPYKGPVARIRETMERERALVGLTGEIPASPDSCTVAQRVLRASLLTPLKPWLLESGHRSLIRPWRLGTDMIGPRWLWIGLARVVNDPDYEGQVQVWTRKAHRAWRRSTFGCSTVAAAILRGEVTDGYLWR